MSQAHKPTALLLVSDNCPHCHTMKNQLQHKLEQGLLETLDIVNIQHDQAVAERYAVRSVPWLRLGDFIFSGALTSSELDRWIRLSQQPSGDQFYLKNRLEEGNLQSAIDYLSEHSESLSGLFKLLSDDSLKMNVRIGIGAVIEHFEGTAQLQQAVSDIRDLLRDSHGHNRADACYYLSLTGLSDVKADLEALLNDNDPEVRSIAKESLNEMQ